MDVYGWSCLMRITALPPRPHKSDGTQERKAPPARHYPVYIGAYTIEL